MDPISLTLTVCLIAAPDRCETREAALFEIVTACLMAAQSEAARWIGDHPAYRLAAWRCGREEMRL